MTRKIMVVTGGTHGIGRSCVTRLCEEQYTVLFSGRDEKAGLEIEETHDTAIFHRCDVNVEEDCISLVDRAMELGEGKITGLVNNAGMSLRADFHETTLLDWDRIMSTNARSVYHITRLCLDGLLTANGNVVTTSSVAGLVGQKGLALYTASKAAIIGLTQALALEYGDRVRFNAICPGQVGTRMMQGIMNDDKRLSATVAAIPAGRLGSPEEVANVVVWLLSSASGFVNGAIIPVDGGETAGIIE